MKCDRAFSLELVLNGKKIAQNVTKVGVDACLPMGHPTLFSNLNSEKLVKVENLPCVFARLGLKGRENSLERRESWRAHLSTNGTSKSILKFQFREVGALVMHACLQMGHPNLCSILNSEKLVKVETRPYIFR
jgi:hypothetical protein